MLQQEVKPAAMSLLFLLSLHGEVRDSSAAKVSTTHWQKMTFRSGWHQVVPRQREKPCVGNQSGQKSKSLSSPQECRNDNWCDAGVGWWSKEHQVLRCLGVRVVAAVSADLDLERRQVVKAALLHLVAQAFLLLLDHGTPHLLQRGVILLLHHHLACFISVASSSLGGGRRWWRRRRVSAWRAVARLALLTRAALDVVGAQAAPQVACSRRSAGWQVKPRTQCSCHQGKSSNKWTYFSFGLWMSWRKTLCRPDWPRPVGGAHLCSTPWQEEPLWLGMGRESAPCLESNAVFRVADARLRRAVAQVEHHRQQQQIIVVVQLAHLSWLQQMPQGAAASAVHAFSPPEAAWCRSLWRAMVIWIWFVMLLLQLHHLLRSGSCSEDIGLALMLRSEGFWA